jgi:hypothetical protein
MGLTMVSTAVIRLLKGHRPSNKAYNNQLTYAMGLRR